MSARAGNGEYSNYFSRFFTIAGRSLAQLVRSPSHSRRAEAARRSARHVLLLTAILSAAIIALMYALDAREIALMPPRGTASLWPIRILTDFGKAAYVLWALAGLLLVVAIVSAALRGNSRSLLLGLGTRLQFVFFAVLVPVLVGDVFKWIVGRGRPFVGGEANVFNFRHFGGTEAFASFPSGHAVTSFALAFAISALWPQARLVMIVYAIAIALSRLVLLAHHPSDVVAGALVGLIGAMAVRYWFAARRLGFAIRHDGAIVPLPGPSLGHLKRVACGPFAP
ncbi:phosphatase PAP2 family protein [Bradyrhizobium sediminis]|uniref:Phosphatase PAP2 family protein n=1 Tax=Bradyrhizobium sediminis TaxID=2840469 RepID=A0A975RQP3_9BRAD|nr:phosphatase PAP2 family protein [Bradyrhizobium sediminis]QWG16048.1 phosphatase PAP2 family protein [Bradyrhizobium sediminis]